MRELTGGIYFGDKEEGTERASDLCTYSREEVERIARVAFSAARSARHQRRQGQRAGDLAAVARASSPSCTQREFPNIELEHLLVDNAAMQLVAAPARTST